MQNGNKAPGFRQLYDALVTRVLKGKGFSTQADRQAAFNDEGLAEPLKTLLDKVAHQAYKVSAGDIDAVKKSGVAEDQLFELVICAAIGQSSRQYINALDALEEAVKINKGGPHAS